MPTIADFASKQALEDRAAFLEAVGGEAVLIRLDERGGRDEPAPWAFRGAPRAASVPPRDDEAVDATALRAVVDGDTAKVPRDALQGAFRPSDPDEDTATAAPPPPRALPVPPARGAASVHVLPGGETVTSIGRGDGCAVSIAERSVSKHHAEISATSDGGFRIAEAGSSNGTTVNGREVVKGRTRPLKSGDVVAFGDVSCLFLDVGSFHEHLPALAD